MDLYRVLIADDEEEVLEGILQKIKWEKIGFTVVGSALNGVDALEKASRLRPDLVLTDIKMPFMSGLELCERLRRSVPSAKLVVFSGFDDFEFAQKAIKLHVTEYILKPIDSAELTETLKRIKVQLDREISTRRDIEKLRRAYQQSLPVMRKQFLVGLIEGHVSGEALDAQAKQLRMDSRAAGYAVGLLRPGPLTDEKNVLKGREELIPISVQEMLEEILKNYCEFIDFLYFGCVTVIAVFQKDGNIMPFLDGMSEVCKAAPRALGMKAMAGIGDVVPDLHGLRGSYSGAMNALEYSAVMGGDRAVYIKDMEPDSSARIEFSAEDEHAVFRAVKMADAAEIEKQVGAVFARFESVLLPLSRYRVFFLELLTSLLKLIHSYGLDEDDIFGKGFRFTDILTQFRSLDEIRGWCTGVCKKIGCRIQSKRSNGTRLLAESAKRYVRENYRNPELSVESLCLDLHVSPAYFSTVFKRETGESFVSFLTGVRLKKAVELLNTTEDKTYVIAKKVGYHEPNYFSYVFKKKYGVSPSRYRNP